MKILLAVDESPYSEAATQAVSDGPWAQGSTVRVLTVMRPVAPMATELWYAPTVDVNEWEADLEKHSRELVSRVAARLQSAGIEAKPVIRKGDPRTGIVDEAEEWNADLIVLGSHGYTGLRRALLGSVSQFVVSHAQCSVQVVRARGSSDAG